MAAVVWGSQLYHLHVPTVQKFWKPQPPEALPNGRAVIEVFTREVL